jgi:hypothetical protein
MWESRHFEGVMTSPEESIAKKELRNIAQAVTNIYDIIRQYELTGEDYTTQSNLID